jgi:hypothetical protein
MTWTINGSVESGDLDVFAVDKTLGDYRVCMVDCDNDSVSNHDHEANARLIAAAPDLLQALHDVDAYLAPQGGEEDTYNYIRAIIKGAISKAQGA